MNQPLSKRVERSGIGAKHKESECKGIDFKPSYDGAKKGSTPKDLNSPRMKLANALAAISDKEDDE